MKEKYWWLLGGVALGYLLLCGFGKMKQTAGT